jgi:thioesterase domain-containing protein/acyl carrier protein
LRQHPRVEDAVVIVRDAVHGHKELVAYLASAAGADDPALLDELRTQLRKKLPEYMMPGYFVVLETLPLTPNGKIDRRALPSAERHRTDQPQSRPHNAVEEQLAQIWKDVLGLEEIGVNENFFEVGGHSLLAVRLVSEIELRLGQKLPLVSLFQNSSIARLAEVLSHELDASSWSTLVQIQKGQATAPLFCVSMPNVNALGYVALARHLGSEQTVYGLQAQYAEDLQGEHSQYAVDELATEYLEAVRRVQPHGPYQFVGMCRGAHIGFEMARRLTNEGERVAFVGVLDTWVLENTYNKFLYVEYYARRLRGAFRLGLRQPLQLLKKNRVANFSGTGIETGAGNKALANPMRAYFPGPSFQPKTYPGRVAVFRTRVQPLNRIRDKGLGWSTLALGGVDVHYVPGKHGASVLREPNVQLVAAEIRKYLLR